MTLEELPPGAVDPLPSQAALAPPAEVMDKRVYSPWVEPGLHGRLRARGVDTLVVTGAETDMCVLAAALGAVDLGYRVAVPTDAVCRSSDRTHDALLALHHERHGQQVEAVATEGILRSWR